MNLSWIILIIAGAINLGLVSLIAIKQKKALKKTINVTFTLSVIFLLLWSLFNSLADNSANSSAALFWTKAAFPASLLVLFMILWFSYAFPIKLKNYGWKIIVYFLLTAGFSALSMGKYVIESVELNKNIGISGIYLGSAYPAIMAFYLLLLSNIIYTLYIKYKKNKGVRRAQIKYVIMGWGLFLSGAILTNLILPYFTGNANWSKFGPLFSVFMVSATAYAIIRHHLMDIRVVIQRGLVYTTLLVLIVSFYLTVVFIFGYFFQRITDATVLFSAGLTVVAGVFGVPPLKRYFTKATDKIFFKNKYDYFLAMRELSEILNKNINIKDITEKVSEKLKEIMKTKKAVLSVISLEKQAGRSRQTAKETEEGEIKISITLENKPIGAIILGKKLSGDPYTDEDIKLLQTFAYQAGVALKKSELYEIMKNYSCKLEETVMKRTAKIEEMHGKQKQIMMDISHGLQTPLTIIKGELGLLKKQNINAENFASLEKSIDRISKFIYDLLRLARLEMFEGDFKKEPVDISRMLKDLMDEFNIMAKEKNITITGDISSGIIVLGDKSKLEELAANLVSNAIKYISNERKIFVKLRKIGNTVKLDVKDTGIGIKEKDISNIFNRFYRVRENNHLDAKGTGLGLAICKKIAEKHGGAIGAESELGKGTIFTVVLPARLTP